MRLLYVVPLSHQLSASATNQSVAHAIVKQTIENQFALYAFAFNSLDEFLDSSILSELLVDIL